MIGCKACPLISCAGGFGLPRDGGKGPLIGCERLGGIEMNGSPDGIVNPEKGFLQAQQKNINKSQISRG
jgi:hypothetical protein